MMVLLCSQILFVGGIEDEHFHIVKPDSRLHMFNFSAVNFYRSIELKIFEN